MNREKLKVIFVQNEAKKSEEFRKEILNKYKKMSTNEKKKIDEQSYSDSGFHSGFVESSEILQSEEKENVADDKTSFDDMRRGISQDKGFNDSGIILQSPESEEYQKFVPEFLHGIVRRPATPMIEKYFEQDEDGYTKLHIAILHNVTQAINALIALVPDTALLNIRNSCGQTAMHLAVLMGQSNTVRKLIDAGAALNIRDNRCNTPLHLACLNENLSCVLTLISAVSPQKEQKLLANLEQWNYEGETSFFIACKAKNISIMKALVANGADVNAREGRSGYTSLHFAVEIKSREIVKFLCENCTTLSIDTENYAGLTAFQLCLLTTQEELAKYLMARGATPFLTDSDSEMEDDDDEADYSGDELEHNQIISKIAEIAVN